MGNQRPTAATNFIGHWPMLHRLEITTRRYLCSFELVYKYFQFWCVFPLAMVYPQLRQKKICRQEALIQPVRPYRPETCWLESSHIAIIIQLNELVERSSWMRFIMNFIEWIQSNASSPSNSTMSFYGVHSAIQEFQVKPGSLPTSTANFWFPCLFNHF